MTRNRLEDLGRIAELAKRVIDDCEALLDIRKIEHFEKIIKDNVTEYVFECQRLDEVLHEIYEIARWGDDDDRSFLDSNYTQDTVAKTPLSSMR